MELHFVKSWSLCTTYGFRWLVILELAIDTVIWQVSAVVHLLSEYHIIQWRRQMEDGRNCPAHIDRQTCPFLCCGECRRPFKLFAPLKSYDNEHRFWKVVTTCHCTGSIDTTIRRTCWPSYSCLLHTKPMANGNNCMVAATPQLDIRQIMFERSLDTCNCLLHTNPMANGQQLYGMVAATPLYDASNVERSWCAMCNSQSSKYDTGIRVLHVVPVILLSLRVQWRFGLLK
jgi:hypothetical protein